VSEYDQKEKEAYEALKLSEGASQTEIKEQYRKLARELHSDVNTTGNEDVLKEVNRAYETLTNPAKIAAREQAKRRSAAEKTKADAARRADEAKAQAARKQRERSARESEVFGERLGGQAAETSVGTLKVPRSAPPSSSSSGPQQVPTSAPSLWRVAFLAAPIGIMFFVVPAMNAHSSAFLDVISVVCFFWLIAGVAGVFIEW
jgi:curved DNA-binding protein CbpA